MAQRCWENVKFSTWIPVPASVAFPNGPIINHHAINHKINFLRWHATIFPSIQSRVFSTLRLLYRPVWGRRAVMMYYIPPLCGAVCLAANIADRLLPVRPSLACIRNITKYCRRRCRLCCRRFSRCKLQGELVRWEPARAGPRYQIILSLRKIVRWLWRWCRNTRKN